MTKALSSLRCSALFIITSICLSPSLLAQTALSESHLVNTWRIESIVVDPFMSDIEERILLQRLRESMSISIRVKTLRGVSNAFEVNLPLVIDERALEEIGISADDEFKVEDGKDPEPAGASLRWILRKLNLTFVIWHGKVVITTEDAAETMRALRIYDITPLLSTTPQNGRSMVDPTPLIDTIESSVQPDTWERLGGPSTICPTIARSRCLLVISAPTMVHLDVDQLLNQLHRTGAASISSEHCKARHVTPLKKQIMPSHSTELPVFGGMF